MKTTLFIGLVVSMLVSSCSNEIEPVTLPIDNQVAAKTDASTARGSDCQSQYERKCNFGNPLSILPGTIIDMTSVDNYCRQTSISCPVTECVARLDVLFGFIAGSPKGDSCLPAGYHGK